jgi:hypothetical protein
VRIILIKASAPAAQEDSGWQRSHTDEHPINNRQKGWRRCCASRLLSVPTGADRVTLFFTSWNQMVSWLKPTPGAPTSRIVNRRASRHKTPTLRRSHARLSRPGRGIGHSELLDNGTDMPVVVPSTRNQLHRPPSTTAPRAEVKGARVAAFVSCIPLMQPGCQGNCSLRCGRQNGHAPSTSNRPPTTMNTRVTEKPARKCGRV